MGARHRGTPARRPASITTAAPRGRQRRGPDWPGPIRRPPTLSRADEHRLIERARAGDHEAMSHLVEANLTLVRMALRAMAPWSRADDLLGVAYFGLRSAVSRYDAARGHRFMTYAAWWIRDALASAPGAPRRRRRLVAARSVSLEQATGAGLRPLADLLRDHRPRPDEALLKEQEGEELRAALAELPERDRRVLVGRFGLDDEGPRLTLAALAAALGVSRERVRQLEKQALARLHGLLAPRLGRLSSPAAQGTVPDGPPRAPQSDGETGLSAR